MNNIAEDTKIRNWNIDDSQNMNWAKLLLRLRDGKKESMTEPISEDAKYGRFITKDDRVIFVGGPGGGAGGTSAGSASGKLPKATYEEGRENTATMKDGTDFIKDGVNKVGTYSTSIYAPESERERIKDEIVTELREDTGVNYGTVNMIIRSWADTSNDHDPNSLAVQQEAAKMFGSPLSEWQQKTIDSYTKEFGSPEPTIATRAQIRSVLNSMYENTQTRLAEAGFPEYVTLQRGVTGISMPQGSIQNVHTNTLSSFTSFAGVAKNFARDGVIVEIQVPRSRILATARTGFGCLTEAEFVIIGNNIGAGDQIKVVVGQ